jgi:4-amino-4-deoxy-L-arabinose transferase-like glycosyltransferase
VPRLPAPLNTWFKTPGLRFQLPPAPAALALLAAAFVLPGLLGHDPWKAHDALNIAIAWEMAASGDAVVPRIADLVWLADPPLYHWFAAALGRLLGFALEFHAGARVASGLAVAAALWFLHVASRDWSLGEERSVITGAGGLLLLMGSVGLIVHAHEALPELASLAAISGALAVLPYSARRPVPAGFIFGAALGFAFLSATWVAPAAIAVAVLVAHLVCPEWRTRAGVVFLACALAPALAIAASWPLALYLRSPELFAAWTNLAFSPYGEAGANLRYFLSNLSWFAWPAWPLALWCGWALRRRSQDPRVLVPGLASVLMLAGIVGWSAPQDVNLIPLLAPLCLLASQGIPTLRRGAAAALDWFGVMTFAFFAGLVWLGYVAMMTGLPPRVANNFAKLAPGFTPQFELVPFVVALALSAGWIYVVFFTTPSPLRSVMRWAAGMALLWGTFSMLWMPWADHQKSYRSVAMQLRQSMPKAPAGKEACVAARDVGIPQRAALHYHAGIRTRDWDAVRPQACPLLLVQGHAGNERTAPGRGWTKLAELGRPGDRHERLRLYALKR